MKKDKITLAKKKLTIKEPMPIMKWQVGKYSRYASFQFVLPYQFLLLCKLVDVTPETVILDFLDNLNCGSWKRQGRDKAKEKLIEYFIEHGYGQHQYSKEDIQQIFQEMDAIGLLFPKDAEDDMIDLYSQWREKHCEYWFEKWFKKPRRKF